MKAERIALASLLGMSPISAALRRCVEKIRAGAIFILHSAVGGGCEYVRGNWREGGVGHNPSSDMSKPPEAVC